MTPRRRDAPAADTLSPEDEHLLRYGCNAPLPSRAKHDELRALWRVHGDRITATMPRGEKP